MGYRIFLALGKLRHCNLSVIDVGEKQRIISKTMLSTLDKADVPLHKALSDRFEAILINDGSKDGSAALCAQAVAEDARFRFIDQPNGGVAAARNAGLDAARGEYIFFLDPDDWVESDAAEVLYHTARNANADCVQFGMFYDVCDENGKLLHSETDHCTFSGVYRGKPFKEHFDEMASSYLIINKLFRRAFLEQHHLRFPCHQLGEDGLFFVAFYRRDPGCLVVLEKSLYHYTIARRGSLSNSYHPERLEDNFYLSDAVWDTVAAWGLLDSPMHRAKANYLSLIHISEPTRH